MQLTACLGLEPFGNELHRSRAEAARTAVGTHLAQRTPSSLRHRDRQVNRVFWSPLQQMQVKKGAFGLLFFNPPYDHDDENGGRLELTLLKAVRPALCADGVLVFVLPQRVLAWKAVAEYLASHFHDLRVVAHPGEYRAFNEVTVFGIHNRRAAVPDATVVERLRQHGRGEVPLAVIGEGDESFVYTIPKSSVAAGDLVFRKDVVSAAEIAAEAARHGVLHSDEWRRHVQVQSGGLSSFRPLTPLRRGHLVNLIAAGMLNNNVLTHGDGRQLFIKGQTFKALHSRMHREYDTDGEGGYTEITTDTERFATRIVTLTADGVLERREGAKLEGFLQEWIQPLTEAVTRQYNPVYRFDTNGYRSVLERLNPGRVIPNTNGLRGLLPAQQHAVAAVATRLDSRHLNAKDAILKGEMGVGKTLMGPAVAACIRARRVLILCPPHLIAKWEREIRHVLPDARVIQLKTISDVDLFFEMDASVDLPVFGVMKETSARSASGWEHAYTWCGSVNHKPFQKRKANSVRYGSAIVAAVQNSKWESDAQTATVEIAGREHELPLKQLIRYIRKFRVPQSPDSGRPLLSGDVPMSPAAFGRKRETWHRIGERYEPLYQFTRRYPKGKRGLTLREALARQTRIQANIRAGFDAYDPFAPFQVNRILKPNGYAKWPLATYILKRYRGCVDLLCCDEVHEMKGHDSDRGYAFGRLVKASRKVLGLTGTIYGGKASTLFSLLYRTSREMQRTYGHRSIARWTEEYGVLQEVERVHFDADGRMTGNSRANVTVKELPGASPAMMRWLLDRTVFVNLEDMGFALPTYKEEPVLLDMSPDMQLQYDVLKEQLKNELKEMLIRGDRSLLAAYLQALLAWPDSPWRPKRVEHPHTGQTVAAIPGLPEMAVGVAPKEAALLRQIQAEIAAGRSVLLLCQQTMTLDITPQWVQLLESHGIKTAVLTVEPARREAWIEKQTERGTQVIISHPRRVQTGLDLLGFPTILWMAIDYSVYTVKQASRRSYRIGQHDDVLVQFYAYRGTLQEQALRLVAAKMAAADRIDGTTVDTDSLTELDELVQGDLITTLARIVIGEEELAAPSLSDAFAEANAALQTNLAYLGVDAPESGARLLPEPQSDEYESAEQIDVVVPMERLLVERHPEEGNHVDDETDPLLAPATHTPSNPARSLWELLRG